MTENEEFLRWFARPGDSRLAVSVREMFAELDTLRTKVELLEAALAQWEATRTTGGPPVQPNDDRWTNVEMGPPASANDPDAPPLRSSLPNYLGGVRS